MKPDPPYAFDEATQRRALKARAASELLCTQAGKHIRRSWVLLMDAQAVLEAVGRTKKHLPVLHRWA